MPQCVLVDSILSDNDDTRDISRRWFYGVALLYAAAFLVYAVTWAFTYDECYHLLAAQLIGAGRLPYIDFCFPQTPLNAYWNALWMHLLGWNWRVPHVFAALFTISAVLLTADYLRRRLPIRGWQVAGAIFAVLAIGLNGAVVEYGAVQAYGIALFGLAASFRLTVRAVDRDGWMAAAAAGLFAGVAAASTLLSAAAAPVLLIWMVYCNRAGNRWKKMAAFAAAIAIPFAPVFWLFAHGPRQSWFNLFRYHVFFRKLYWPETTQHDLEILTQWIDNGQALLLGLLALSGLWYVVRQSGWKQALKAEFYLCGVAGAGHFRGGWPRASHVRAILPVDHAVPGDPGGGRVVHRLPRVRGASTAVAGAGDGGAFGFGVGQSAVRTPAIWTTGAPTSAWRRRWIR